MLGETRTLLQPGAAPTLCQLASNARMEMQVPAWARMIEHLSTTLVQAKTSVHDPVGGDSVEGKPRRDVHAHAQEVHPEDMVLKPPGVCLLGLRS